MSRFVATAVIVLWFIDINPGVDWQSESVLWVVIQVSISSTDLYTEDEHPSVLLT